MLGLIQPILALFSGKRSIDALLDAGGQVVDKFTETDTEKQLARAKVLETQVEWLRAASPSREMRRAIAGVVTFIWALFWIVVITMEGLAPFLSIDTATAFYTSAGNLSEHGGLVNTAFIIVLLFYFIAPIASMLGQKTIERIVGKFIGEK